MRSFIKLVGMAGVMAFAVQGVAWAAPDVDANAWTTVDTVTANLKKRYPATPFKDIKESVIAGVYQVSMGKNVGYVDVSGRYFMFGKLFDMQTQTDLTEQPMEAATKIDFKSLPLKDSYF